jgi:uncharacterized membrane protein YidH (DUF202 family)
MATPATPGPAEDIEDRDPGLARERTDLAWTRTAISFAALGAAMLRTNAVAGALVIVAGAAVWGLGQLSARDAQAAGRRHLIDQRRTVQIITGTTTLVSVVALILVLLAPGQAHL